MNVTPMMFLGGVFMPVAAMPPSLQVLARLLPLTYSVEVLQAALSAQPVRGGLLDLVVLAGFALALSIIPAPKP